MAGPDIWGCRKRGVAIFTFAQGVIFAKHPPVHTLEEQNPPSEGLPPSAAWPRSHHRTLGTFWETGSPYSGPDPRALRTPCPRALARSSHCAFLAPGGSFLPAQDRAPPLGTSQGQPGRVDGSTHSRCLASLPPPLPSGCRAAWASHVRVGRGAGARPTQWRLGCVQQLPFCPGSEQPVCLVSEALLL